MIDGDYETALWEAKVGPVRQEREGGSRCAACTLLRLLKTAERAVAERSELFGTSLTSGNRKNATVINAQGRAIGQKFGLTFLDEDWKKGGRTEKGRQMVRERNIYRQNYCGCRFSHAEMLIREEKKKIPAQ
jgi:predicted adenine nucleotide alpha hydrolase (AANH) superfamily ATPase